MKWRPVVLFVLFLVGGAFFACESDVSEQGGGDEETACATNLDQIDFGKVTVGEFKDTCLTIGVALEDGHIADTIVIDCPGFHFVDTLSGQTFDTLIYDLTYPEDTSFCVRFEPVEAVPTICPVNRGSDCGDLGLSGIGALSGYEMVVIEFPSAIDLYDVEVSLSLGVLVCGDSGTVAVSMDLATWQDPCSGPLTTSPLRDIEGIYDMGGALMTVAFAGGGGEEDGLVFGECDLVFDDDKIEYFTSSFVFYNEQYVWMAGRGHDLPNGYNGLVQAGMELDSFTLYQPTSEISDIDGSSPSKVWAVLTEPSHSLYHFDGSSWELATEGWMTEGLHGVWVHESGEVFAVGTNGAIYHYTGSAWEDQSLDFEAGTLHGVWGFSPVDVYAVGEGMAVYHYNGDFWAPLPTPPWMTETLFAVYGLDLGDLDKYIFAVGENGTVIGYMLDIPLPLFGTGVFPGGATGIFERMNH